MARPIGRRRRWCGGRRAGICTPEQIGSAMEGGAGARQGAARLGQRKGDEAHGQG